MIFLTAVMQFYVDWIHTIAKSAVHSCFLMTSAVMPLEWIPPFEVDHIN